MNFLFLKYKIKLSRFLVIGNNNNIVGKWLKGLKVMFFFQFSTLLKESREGTCIDMCVAYRDCTYMLLSVWTSCQK